MVKILQKNTMREFLKFRDDDSILKFCNCKPRLPGAKLRVDHA